MKLVGRRKEWGEVYDSWEAQYTPTFAMAMAFCISNVIFSFEKMDFLST